MTNPNQRGFTLVEVMIASAIMVVALGMLLSLYAMGQRFFRAGMNQIDVTRDARASLERISRHIRSAESIQIFDDYSSPTAGTQGNYVEIIIPGANDVGFYLNNQGELRYIDDLSIDNPVSEADDEIIADEVVGVNIFSSEGIAIEISFSIRDACARDGYQGIDLWTRAEPRNN